MTPRAHYHDIADKVYPLAESQDSLAPLVNESLKVIDDALDTFGCAVVYIHYNRILFNDTAQARIISP